MTNPLENELVELEAQFWLALKNNDVDTALRLTDEPCILTGASGVSAITKPVFEKMMRAAPYTLDDFQLSDTQVRMLSDDVAIVAYKVHEDLTLDGKTISLDAADASTWVRRGNQWVCALHTEAIAGDPFGRDRTGKSA